MLKTQDDWQHFEKPSLKPERYYIRAPKKPKGEWYLVDRAHGGQTGFKSEAAAKIEMQNRLNPIPNNKGWGWV